MGAFAASSAANRIRPSSEVLGNQNQSQQRHSTTENEVVDQAVQEWLQDVDNFELTLNEMAQATMDQDFKDELRAIEKWFKVLTEAERTAALYSLLQQTTQVQARFFITVLQHNSRQQPNISMLSPSSLEKGMIAAPSQIALAKMTTRYNGKQTHGCDGGSEGHGFSYFVCKTLTIALGEAQLWPQYADGS